VAGDISPTGGQDVSAPTGFTRISTAAVRGLAAADAVDVDVFLPGGDGNDAVLYSTRTDDAPLTESPPDRAAQGAADGLGALDFERLAAHGVSHVLVRAEDLVRCEHALEVRLRDLLANPNLTSHDRAEIVHSAGAAVAREIMTTSLSSDSLSRATALTDGIVEGVMNDPAIAGYILQMAGHERSTASHMQMVATLAVIFGAEVFGDDPETLNTLALAGMLHDVGKLSVPADTLHKTGPLTEREVQLIQQHPIESVRLIGDDKTVSPLVRKVILQHHERLDGRGYPLGLTAGDILPFTRLLTIVDTFHAMIGPRSYRAALSVSDANRVMAYQAGKQFDKDMLDCWINLCDRHNPTIRSARTARASAGDDCTAKHEHLPARRNRAIIQQRRPRYVCAGKAAVRCIYTGRLADVTEAPDDFGASVHDVSQGGMCIYSAHPMYRGEIVCVHINTHTGADWVRSMVSWCATHEVNVYRVGLRFLSKLDERDVREQIEVQPMGGFVTPADASAMDTDRRLNAESGDDSDPARAVNGKREEALDRLAAIASMRCIDGSAERTVIVLSTSSDVMVRLKALDVLAQCNTRATRGALVALLHDPNRDVRVRAIDAAGLCEITEAARALRELLDDPDEQVVLHAAGSLGALRDWSGLHQVGGTLELDGPNLRLAVCAFSRITGHRFPANRDGIASARNYWAARKKDLLSKMHELVPGIR
jgi:HD-GYP domain-containing protein (c-di-GMP phosphodiesterase class II)